VVLPVVVTDKQGRYISDVPSQQFTILDNGRRVPIELFSNEDTPVTIGLILDASGSMRSEGSARSLRRPWRLPKSSNPQDELFAIRFNDRRGGNAVTDRPFLLASDLGTLESAVSALRPAGTHRAVRRSDSGTRSSGARIARAQSGSSWSSDGGDNASEATLDRVLKRAGIRTRRSNTIGILDEDDLDRNPRVLKSAGGGDRRRAVSARSPADLLRVCERIRARRSQRLHIGYARRNRDGAYHRVRVLVDPSPSRRL